MAQQEEKLIDLMDQTADETEEQTADQAEDQTEGLMRDEVPVHLPTADEETTTTLSPPLTPNRTGEQNNDILHLIHFLQTSSMQEQDRRRQEEQNFRLQMEQSRQEDNQRFMSLFSLLSGQIAASQPQQTNPMIAPPVTPVPPPPGFSENTPSVSSKPTVHPPPLLQQDATYQAFRQWRLRFEDYAALVGLDRLHQTSQLIHLRTCISLDVQRLLTHTLGIPPNTSLSLTEVLDTLQKHFRSLRNEALRRRELLSCKQALGESFADYYARLKDLADEVDLCTGNPTSCTERQLQMVILMGVRDEELIQRLIPLQPSSTLAEFVTCCRSASTCATASAIASSPSQVNALSTYKKNQRLQKRTSHRSPDQRSHQSPNSDLCQYCSCKHDSGQCPATGASCNNCGRTGHWPRTQKCPAKETQCKTCQKQGHFEKMCRSTKKSQTGNTASPPPNKSNPGCRFVGDNLGSESPTPVTVSLSFGDISSHLQLIPDTGADITVIGTIHLDALRIPRTRLEPPPMTDVVTADGSPMTPAVGYFQATLCLGNKSCSATIHVHEDIQTPLLSREHCRALAIVSPEFPKPILKVIHVNRCAQFPASAITSLAAIKDYFLRHFSDVLISKKDLQTQPLKKMAGPPMRIHLKPGATPFAVHTPRPIPFALRDQVKEELDSLVQQGIIRPAGDEPSEWCHPMVLVPKDKGVRITVDNTHLNSQVARPTHPSPTPHDAVRNISPTAKYFTTADALHGYWQMELAEEDRHLTTFITPYGRFQHCRGPMGFSATSDANCLRGDMALQGVPNCVKVVDDILLSDEDLPSHLQHVHQMLTRCRQYGITLNKEKFTVAAPKVNFCGYVLSSDGIAADPDKVSAIRDFPTPSNVTDVRLFMGLVNQLADFTPDIAAAAQPLRPLMSPKRSFVWTPDHERAFKKVKTALTSPPVLAPFNPASPVVLQTDASRLYGLGYALLQDNGRGQMHLVQCGSRFLTDTETRYATIELELLAVTWASI
ncbi:uncharacterized protein K02A2.6-like [Macrobrachium nipponense]|uniref:uncharacterized protein K02A2.6-like n=1 Tax=Macrobrachium nipponense TaxID=159736 RepID=UPI0030C7B912